MRMNTIIYLDTRVEMLLIDLGMKTHRFEGRYVEIKDQEGFDVVFIEDERSLAITRDDGHRLAINESLWIATMSEEQ